MKRFLSFLVFFLTSFTSLVAQDCTASIRGTVLDEDGKPLAHAAITIHPTNSQVVSGLDGSFSFHRLCPGDVMIAVSFIGYQPTSMIVKIPGSRTLTVRMTPSSTLLSDVVIEGQQNSKSATQHAAILDGETLDALHGKPLGESLKEIPGVSALQTGPSIFKPVIDGLHSQRILILNNGIRQEGQQWGVEHAPEVDPFIASQIEVVKGAETVRYGSAAMGGVILINPSPLHQTKKIGGELNFGLMSNNRMGVLSGLVEGTLFKNSRWSWRLQSSAKKGGDYHAARHNLSNTGLNEINFSGALGYKNEVQGMEIYLSSYNSDIGILRAAHTGNLNDLQQSIESGRPWYERAFTYSIASPRQKINHHLLKLSAYRMIKGIGKINMLYGGQYDQRNEFDIRRSGRAARPSMKLSLISNVLDVSLDHEHSAHSGSIGVNGTVKINTNDTEETGVRPLLPDFEQSSAGFFILEKIKRGKWILEAGGRYDFQHLRVLTFSNGQLIKPGFNFNFLSGTLGATVLFNPQLRLLSNFGISSRPPHVSELYNEGLHHGTASIEEGLMRRDGTVLSEEALIKKEISKKWISTIQHTGENLILDFSVYYNNIRNYVYIRPTGTRLTVRGYFPVFHYEQTNAVLTGTDAALKWEINKLLTYNSKFSYIYARDTRNDDLMISIPPAQFENGLTVSFPVVGRLENFYFNVSVPVTFRQYRAPMAINPGDIGSDVPERNFDFSPAPAGYALLNARIGLKAPITKHSLGITLSGENLLNGSYRNYMNRLRYYADDIGSNFILRVSYDLLSH